MDTEQLDVAVVGAGVSGLTTAVCLAEAGLSVTVHAAVPPQRTTSATAGAIWGPHLVGPDDRIAGWAQRSLALFREITADPAAGVQDMAGTVAHQAARQDPPGWTDGVGPRQRCDPAGLPAGYASGWRYTAPVISMPVYLGYLAARLRRAGGRLAEPRAFGSLDQAAAESGGQVIVNCSGIGARRLVPDESVTPVRGQVLVTANPGVTEFFVGEAAGSGDVAYIFPHADRVVLGGTEIPGDWSLRPDPATAERILSTCAGIEPRLRSAPVIEHLVGLRPTRPSVRLEAEEPGDGRLVLHNYGHGGAGITLSWGCALEVTERVLRAAAARLPCPAGATGPAGRAADPAGAPLTRRARR
jgi:D-amino-acid oxidase